MNHEILAELTRDVWAMEPRALEAFLQTLARSAALPQAEWRGAVLSMHSQQQVQLVQDGPFPIAVSNADPAQPAAFIFGEAPRRTRMSIADGVATVPVSGVLLKRVPVILRLLGIEATGYSEIAADIEAALADPEVKRIRLAVDSPGGQVSGVKEAADAIFAARAGKREISAEIQDLGASAAYWLASQAGRITAGENAQIGSIGVYSAYVDASRMAENEGVKVHVVSSGPHKGMGVYGAAITPEQLKAQQELIDGLAANFRRDVARGRGRAEKDVDEWMSGRTWLAQDAARLGLIDGLAKTEKRTSSGVPAAADLTRKGETMTDQEKAAAAEQAKQEAVTAERTRVAAIKAAFPRDPAFALEQVEKGATVEQAKAAYADVLAERNVKLEAEKAELAKQVGQRAQVPASKGADPVPMAAEGSPSSGATDFITRAKALAKERGISVSAAMSALAKSEPEIYRRHIEASQDAVPSFSAWKKRVGVGK